jgi:methylphosphotriester-DNA--protein-cysteine methyltransferase
MINHTDINATDLRKLIRRKKILLGGNRKLKIYGTLNCRSGKRMKRESRVFFTSINDATENDYRPCGHCLYTEYKKWENGSV